MVKKLLKNAVGGEGDPGPASQVRGSEQPSSVEVALIAAILAPLHSQNGVIDTASAVDSALELLALAKTRLSGGENAAEDPSPDLCQTSSEDQLSGDREIFMLPAEEVVSGMNALERITGITTEGYGRKKYLQKLTQIRGISKEQADEEIRVIESREWRLEELQPLIDEYEPFRSKRKKKQKSLGGECSMVGKNA